MRLDRLITLSLARPYRALRPLPETGCIPILMYHRISSDPEPRLRPYYRLNTTPVRFAEQMRFLRQQGYKTVDLLKALELLKANGFTRKHLVITFDDGYQDFYTAAFPILREHGFTATVFLPTSFISIQRIAFREAPCLTWDELRLMRQEGIRFGSHTVSHPKLVDLPWPQIHQELFESKRVLEDQLQEPVTTFAYPYAFPDGHPGFAAGFSEALRETGYECCLTTRIGIASSGNNPFALPRQPVNDCDDLEFFSAKLAGAYDWLAIPQKFRKLKHRRTARPAPLNFGSQAESSILNYN